LLTKTLGTLANQDLAPSQFEVVVCDDGSTEDIESAVTQFRDGRFPIRIARQMPLGPAAARNLGIRSTSSSILIFFDSDVLVESCAVREMIEALESHPEWSGAEAALHPQGSESGVLWDAPSSLNGGRYHTAAIAYRRQVLLSIGGFDEEFTLPACEDVELALRALEHGTIGFVPDAVVLHPKRRVTWKTHWRWRQHWRYETLLSIRYGILAFPGKTSGVNPRFRVACAALLTLPIGRFLTAVKSIQATPRDAALAAVMAVFDVFCGFVALPSILFEAPRERKSYLAGSGNQDVNSITA
jgi:Predicted glycosyltransferases